jgi:hypothetical protein
LEDSNAFATHPPISANDIYDMGTANMTDTHESAPYSAVDLLPWAMNIPFTAPSASLGAVAHKTNQQNRNCEISEEFDRAQTTVSRPAEINIVDKLTNLSETEIANFDRAYLHHSRMLSDNHVLSPPGNVSFPSVFSGHLAACEYFIKQSKAFQQRRSEGGSER